MIPRFLPRTRPRRLILLCGLVPTLAVAILSVLMLAEYATAFPLVEFRNAPPAVYKILQRQPPGVVATAGLALFAALLLPVAGLRCAAAVMAGALLLGEAPRAAEGGFNLVAMDTGQGLATVVETAHHTLVFDTGPRWQSGSTAASVSLLPYLRGRGIRAIDVLVVSHDDADHSGGAESLRRGRKTCGEFWGLREALREPRRTRRHMCLSASPVANTNQYATRNRTPNAPIAKVQRLICFS